MTYHLRIARPVGDLDRAAQMYTEGLGLTVLYRFEDHDGFDGVMVGAKGDGYHIEFTRCRNHFVEPTPTLEDLLIFYIPSDPEWLSACSKMLTVGFRKVKPHNPYWEQRASTFVDQDGYRVTLHRGNWPSGLALLA
jgi:catechol 2,3-dioxygenase-like lactoylglutathione lyase family enzyme